MTGFATYGRRWVKLPAILSAVVVLAACEEGASTVLSGAQPGAMMTRGEQDVERPDIFSVTDRGLWDGRPSLGGIWVAHPDVREPERVMIRNAATGESTIGALFRRERANPGPVLQLSSDAAEALGILAGAPTQLNVTVLRREEVAVPAAPVAETDETDPLPAPVEIAQTPLAPAVVADAPAATAVAPVAAPAFTGAVPPAPLAQIGVFGVQANADSASATLQSAGFTATVTPVQTSGRQVWLVVAGPVPDPDALARVRALGFADAYILQNP
ncbi:MAG: SPOR domain-containing protein [Loktanella sp.]|nr:SPOR domain-containing protein [Loktanella sp.]